MKETTLFPFHAGPPQPVRQLVRVDHLQAEAAQRHVRGGAQQAAGLLHLPVQGVESGQVSVGKSISVHDCY